MYRLFFKRVLDILLSITAMILLAIPMAIIALLIKQDLGCPVIFRQERIGKDEKPFKMLKFRSMKIAFDEYGVPLSDEQRLTALGKCIRKLSIDELPSLVNILKGDMSIVGPRPLPVNYLPWFKEEERVRHRVRGGLTGMAQVNGRNTVSWEDKFQYDIEYVNNLTFLLDVKIFLKTIMVVFAHKDIGVRGVDAPPDFHVYRSGLSERELRQREEGMYATKKAIDA